MIKISFSLLLALKVLIYGVHSQTTAPDHYYDFTKINNLNGYDYVFDQVTKDDKLSFGFVRKIIFI